MNVVVESEGGDRVHTAVSWFGLGSANAGGRRNSVPNTAQDYRP